jgi:hypothetical protein
MTVTYNPPYDSPIEDIFARNYVKYSSETVEFIPQYQVNTLCGLFILDFVVIDKNGYKVGIECDGKDFHDTSRDEWRDAMILGEEKIDVIYRLRGGDINYYIEDILYLLVNLEPCLFTPRAMKNLEVLASSEVKVIKKDHLHENFHFKYLNEDDLGYFHIENRRRIVPINQRRFWQSAYRYAVSIGGGKLNDVMSSYRNHKEFMTDPDNLQF